MKTIKNKKDVLGNEGFTLVELLTVIAILGIIVAIAVPAYIGYISNSKKTEAKTNLQSLKLLIEQYYSENSRYCPAASCSGQSYAYIEDDSGAVTTNTIRSNNYLASFKPKSAAGANVVLYNYNLTFSSNVNYTITSAPVTSRGAPTGNLTINQDGNKTGW